MCRRYTLSIKDFTKHYGVKQESFEFSSFNVAPTQAVPMVAVLEGHRAAVTAHENPSFKTPLRYRRCLIPADRFYEWRREGTTKTSQYIRVGNGAPFAFAGLFDIYKDELLSCTILTTTPNKLITALHDRMPVILSPSDYTRWLDPDFTDPNEVRDLLHPYSDEMQTCEVSSAVNSPHNNSPGLLNSA